MLTPDDVRRVAFGKPPFGRRGYNENQVDDFLDLLESTLRGTGGQLTARQVREVTFGKPATGKRGYNKTEVDLFLTLAEEQLSERAAARHPTAAPDEQPPGTMRPERR